MLLYSLTIWISLIHLVYEIEAKSMIRHAPRRTRAIESEGGYDVIEIPNELSFQPKVPKECMDIGICEKVPDYPYDYVTQLVDQINKVNKTKFNMDMIDLVNRFGPEEENMQLCDSRQELYVPQAARSSRGKWYYILNKRSEPVQAFRVEYCKKPHGECNPVASFALGNEGFCKQNYILRTMVALDYNGVTFEDFFLIPSCCSCVYRISNIS